MNICFSAVKWQKDSAGMWLSLKCENAADVVEFCENFNSKKHIAELKEWRKKRSKDANDLCWELCTEISESLGNISKEDIYRMAIKTAGKSDFCCVIEKAVPALISAWGSKGIGWFAEVVDDAKISGCKKVILYYGSSTYDTKEMSRLIDYLIQDAEALGINTASPSEVALLKEAWRM